MDRRTELIQQIRSQGHQNRYDMVSREQLLYGKSYGRDAAFPPASQEKESEETQPVSTFKIRLLFALTLLMLMIMMDTTNKSIGNLSIKKISDILAVDYEAQIETQLSDLLAQW
ncbi:MAG: hypothetical protein NC081_02175 [Roseburia sp.]|nr:hypothetical protein [Roseburia sp.]